MKKLISMILLICTAALSFTSCNITEDAGYADGYEAGYQVGYRDAIIKKDVETTETEQNIQLQLGFATPLNVMYKNDYINRIYSIGALTDVHYEVTFWNNDGTYDLKVYHSGTKTYNDNSEKYVDEPLMFEYMLCDSTGVVRNEIIDSPDLLTGESYYDSYFTILSLNPNVYYTLYIFDYII